MWLLLPSIRATTMRSPVVSDSSPLIAFALIDRFSVLRALFPTLWIPDAVVLASGRVTNPGAGSVEEAVHSGWMQRLTVHDQDAVQRQMGRLHWGKWGWFWVPSNTVYLRSCSMIDRRADSPQPMASSIPAPWDSCYWLSVAE